MPTPVDSLRPGQFIVVVADKRFDDPTETAPTPPRWARGFTGEPSEILAISLPFIAVTNGAVIDAIDIRDYDVQVVTKKYAMAMLSRHVHDGRGPIAAPGIAQARKLGNKLAREAAEKSGLIHKPHPRDCPQCGERMVRRREYPRGSASTLSFKSLKATPREPLQPWMLVCKRCGFQRPPEMAEVK